MGRCLNYKEMRFSGFRKGPKIAVTLVTNRGRTAMLTVCQEILSSVEICVFTTLVFTQLGSLCADNIVGKFKKESHLKASHSPHKMITTVF